MMRSELLEMDSSESEPLLVDEASTSSASAPKQPPSVGMRTAMRQFPRSIYCIFCTEFCERFNYYGMRAVLLLYLMSIGYGRSQATALYHGFIVLCYFSPIVGAILSDGFLGKYRVIVSLSLLYAAGSVLLALSSCRPHTSNTWTDLLGLFIIGLGTGGIKPCVSAFGADQLISGQEPLIDAFFSFFYACINTGALLSMIVTPLFRTSRCLGQDTCYPLSFGVPAALMILAVGVFIAGSLFGYRNIIPQTNVITRVFRTCTVRGPCLYSFRNADHVPISTCALVNRLRRKTRRKHWLEHSLDTHVCTMETGCTNDSCTQEQFVTDVRALLRIFVIFLPLPIFWTLFEQQGSRWLIQSSEMDYQLGSWIMPPAIMQALNSILILVFIPLFENYVYPMVRACGIEPTPLRRMVTGCFIAASAFLVAACIQFAVNTSLPQPPKSGTSHLALINTLPCDVQVYSSDYGSGRRLTIAANGSLATDLDDVSYLTDLTPGRYVWQITAAGPRAILLMPSNQSLLEAGQSVNDLRDDGSSTLLLCRDTPCDPTDPDRFETLTMRGRSSDFVAIKPGVWHVYDYIGSTQWSTGRYHNVEPNDFAPYTKHTGAQFVVQGQGGIYTYTLYTTAQGTTTGLLTTFASANTVNILWQVPQFALITAAEILVSITGLQFSYSQSAPALKSVVLAAFYLTDAVGNLVIIVVADTKIFPNLAYELLFFAALMVAIAIIFMLLAIFYYEYRYYEQESSSEASEPSTSKSK